MPTGGPPDGHPDGLGGQGRSRPPRISMRSARLIGRPGRDRVRRRSSGSDRDRKTSRPREIGPTNQLTNAIRTRDVEETVLQVMTCGSSDAQVPDCSRRRKRSSNQLARRLLPARRPGRQLSARRAFFFPAGQSALAASRRRSDPDPALARRFRSSRPARQLVREAVCAREITPPPANVDTTCADRWGALHPPAN